MLTLAPLGLGWAAVAAVMFALWLRQRATRDATSVDVAWAANLGLLALLYALTCPGWVGRRIAIALAAGAWSARLALHLYANRVRGHREEDGRYRALRARWGESAGAKFFVFYQVQAALDVLLSLPFWLAASHRGAGFHTLEIAGLSLLGAAVLGESIADRQLARFRAEPGNRGRTCRLGLWRVSRHPNYFFEWLAWVGFALIAATAPLGWLGWLAPLLMLLLILKVTGIPPTEEQALRSRGDDYREYQRTTSSFFPWFPKAGIRA